MLKKAAWGSVVLALSLAIQACGEGTTDTNANSNNSNTNTNDNNTNNNNGGDCAVDATNAGGDTLCYQQDGGAEVRIVEASAANAHGADPVGIASVTAGGGLFIAVARNHSGDPFEPFSEFVVLDVPSASAGIFDAAAGAKLEFRAASSDWIGSNEDAGSSVSIEIESVGTIGNAIRGSFSATLCSAEDSCATTVDLSGRFDVERDENDYGTTCDADALSAGGDTLCFALNAGFYEFTEAADANPLGADPIGVAFSSIGGGGLVVAAGESYDSVLDPPFARLINLEIEGATAAGSFSVGAQQVSADLAYDGSIYVARNDGSQSYGSGTVTVTALGSPGQAVQGNFTLELCREAGDTVDCDDTIELGGAFDVTREENGWVPECSVEPGSKSACYLVDDGEPVVLTEAAASNPFTVDPGVVAFHLTGEDQTILAAVSGYGDWLDDEPFSTVLSFDVPGSAAGIFETGDGSLGRMSLRTSGTSYIAEMSEAGSQGTLSISSYGAVGASVRASYEGWLCEELSVGNDCDNGISVRGIIDATRREDDWHTQCSVDAAAAGADSACLASEGALITMAEAADANPLGADPLAAGYIDNADGGLFLVAGSGYSGGGDGAPFGTTLLALVETAAVGSHELGSGLGRLSLEAGGKSFVADSSISGSTASLTVTEFGSVGGRIKATYEGWLCLRVENGDPDCDGGISVAGAFDVTREADDAILECEIDAGALGGDAMCYSENLVPTVEVEAVSSANPYGVDPGLIASRDSGSGETFMAMVKTYTSLVASPPFETVVSFNLNNSIPGVYGIADGGLQNFEYLADSSSYVAFAGTTPLGEGIVSISSYGDVGQPITGTFNVRLCPENSTPESCSPVELRGAFEVTRDGDDFFESSCSLAGAGPDELCYSSNGASVLFVESDDPSPTNPLGKEPLVAGAFNPAVGETGIVMASGFGAEVDPPFAEVLVLQSPADPGVGGGLVTADLANGARAEAIFAGNRFVARIEDATEYGLAEISITSYGAPGGTIDGTFSVELCEELGGGGIDCGSTIRLQGLFAVTREDDGFVPECPVDASVAGNDQFCYSGPNFPVTVNEILAPMNPFEGDPAVVASYYPSGGSTFVAFGANYTGVILPEAFDSTVNIDFTGNTPGVYTIEDNCVSSCVSDVSYLVDGAGTPTSYGARSDALSVGRGHLTINEYGAVGGRVRGFYDFELCRDTDVGPDCSDVVDLQGGFDITREADDWHSICDVSDATDDALCLVAEGALLRYDEAPAANPFGADPALYAQYDSGATTTLITLGAGYDVLLSPPFFEYLSIEVPGNTTGTFDETVALASFDYNGLSYGAGPSVAGSSVEIVVQSFGAVGGSVQGTYELGLCADVGGGFDCAEDRIQLSGAFSATRDADL